MQVHRVAFMAHFHLLPNLMVYKSVSGQQLDVSHSVTHLNVLSQVIRILKNIRSTTAEKSFIAKGFALRCTVHTVSFEWVFYVYFGFFE